MTRATAAARKASAARIEAAHAETRAVVATGRCPLCGTGLRRNLALAGWWQCDALGLAQFRRAENRDKADCNWQGFTE
jgi:hypothetical protein